MDKADTHIAGFVIARRNGIAFHEPEREYAILNLTDCEITEGGRAKQSDVLVRLKRDCNLTVTADNLLYIGTTTDLYHDEALGVVANHTYVVHDCQGDAPKVPDFLKHQTRNSF